MLSFRHPEYSSFGTVSRREWLRVGGSGVFGITLPQLLMPRPQLLATPSPNTLGAGLSGTTFGRAKNVIFLWLQGGPPQHETFDPKPDAPLEIRGPFQPIQTNIPGMQFCELLPRTAQRADKLAVIRSLSTDDNNHDVSGYWVLTGYPYGPGSARQIKPSDWPYMGSVIKMLKPSEKLPALTSVWIPDMMRLNDNVTPAGQTGGFLGSMWDPERFVGDPAESSYRIEGLTLPVDLSVQRIANRSELLSELNRHQRTAEKQTGAVGWDQFSRLALDLVTSGRAKAAFDLSKEPDELRHKYGRHSWGQSCLLARRLIEAGVRLVHVNWAREPGDSAVDNPMWDTHALNAERLQDFLCPLFDVSFAALLDDLEQRGLLSETLVVAVGEFGRTPKINRVGGRDHWGPVFSCALAGAGISGGQVFGASDKNGAYPISDAIRPHDLTATIYHLLGIPHDSVFHDLTNRPHPITKGEPLYRLLGDKPATDERCESTADERVVPPFDSNPLVDLDFSAGKLIPVAPRSQAKGWRAGSISHSGQTSTLAASAISQPTPHILLGLTSTGADVRVNEGDKVVLAQEVKNARGGSYSFSVKVSGFASSQAEFDRWFDQALRCRLVLFRYKSMAKTPFEIEELGTQTFRPQFGDPSQARVVNISKFLGSTVAGANFAIGNGLGVGLVLESTATQATGPTEPVGIRVHSAALDFVARVRDDSVTE